MIVVDCEQGSDEWRKHRLGKPSASRFKDIITAKSNAYSSSADRYMNELIAEIELGEECTGFKSEWMDRGLEMEQEACATYENMIDNEVEHVGLVYADDKHEVLCSPDGFTFSRTRGLEIKCPKPEKIVGWIADGILPLEHKAQVMGSMYVSGCDEWDFMAYHPNYEPFIVRAKRDEVYIRTLASYLIRFRLEMAERLERVQNHHQGEIMMTSNATAEVLPSEEEAHIIDTLPLEFNVTEAALDDLKERYGDLDVDATSNEGYLHVKGALDELGSLRRGIENRRKFMKTPALEFGKKVDARAKEITAIIVGLEQPIKDMKKKVDDEKERIEQEKILAEQKRIDDIQARIADMKDYAENNKLNNLSAEAIQYAIDSVDSEPIGQSYEEFQSEAQIAKDQTVLILKGALAEREKYDAEEKQRKEAQAKLDAEREKFEADKAELERQQKEMADAQGKLDKEAADKRAREEQEQAVKEAEEKARALVEQKLQDEVEAKAAADLAAKNEEARLAELAPDKEKVAKYGLALQEFAIENEPKVDHEEYDNILSDLQNDIVNACKRMNKKLQEL